MIKKILPKVGIKIFSFQNYYSLFPYFLPVINPYTFFKIFKYASLFTFIVYLYKYLNINHGYLLGL